MQGTRTIAINGMELKAKIGVHNFEREAYRDFTIDLSVSMECEVKNEPVALDDTIDYAALLAIIQEETIKVDYLLESVVNRILLRVKHSYPTALSASIHLQKKNPPLDAIVDSSSVRLEVKF